MHGYCHIKVDSSTRTIPTQSNSRISQILSVLAKVEQKEDWKESNLQVEGLKIERLTQLPLLLSKFFSLHVKLH